MKKRLESRHGQCLSLKIPIGTSRSAFLGGSDLCAPHWPMGIACQEQSRKEEQHKLHATQLHVHNFGTAALSAFSGMIPNYIYSICLTDREGDLVRAQQTGLSRRPKSTPASSLKDLSSLLESTVIRYIRCIM
jgi:hypothetical protein